MTITVVFVGIIVVVFFGWLLRQTINTRPWIAETAAEGVAASAGDATGDPEESARRFGLVVFLAVVTSFFALFLSAYSLRMEVADWTPLAEPPVLWLNTAVLIAGSVAMQWAKGAASRGELANLRIGVSAAVALTLLFLAGQLVAWRQLVDARLYMQANPSYAFFYLLTALHGLHLLGGLWVLARATAAVWRGGFEPAALRRTVALCTLYWHFLLIVWLALFWLMLAT